VTAASPGEASGGEVQAAAAASPMGGCGGKIQTGDGEQTALGWDVDFFYLKGYGSV